MFALITNIILYVHTAWKTHRTLCFLLRNLGVKLEREREREREREIEGEGYIEREK